jgi:hypothetical protein
LEFIPISVELLLFNLLPYLTDISPCLRQLPIYDDLQVDIAGTVRLTPGIFSG